jgi:FKBP-type peptidyl-prolyl cis-trans isomerase SlyD
MTVFNSTDKATMQITENAAVSIHYTLTDDGGEQLDSSIGAEPLVYLHGCGNIIPGLESALLGKEPGDKLHVVLPPEQAYGIIDDKMVQVVSRKMFDGMEIEVGMQFHAEVSYGAGVITITDISGDDVTINGNHPLAGVALTFDVEVIDVRPATSEEIAHGHVHGVGGHHH